MPYIVISVITQFNMKAFFFILLVALALSKKIDNHIHEVWNNLIKPYKEECIETSKVNLEEVNNMLHQMIVPDDESFHNYLKCIYNHLKMLEPDGTFNHKVILEKAPYVSEELLNTCVDKANPETKFGKKAFLLANCVLNGLIIHDE